jgi:cellulose synthase/poly-beta-1,6-N-acetylglucosamine synthase-like glycosyltransferase
MTDISELSFCIQIILLILRSIFGSQMLIRENLIFNIFFIVFLSSAAIQLFFYAFFYLKAGLYRKIPDSHDHKPVSIIICARNEEDNLRDFLTSVLEQDYPEFEVIVVNDCSEDNSYTVLGELLPRYPHLRICDLSRDPKFTHNKKFAQFIGIKAAKNEILLFTDADCHPETDKWVEGMASHFDEETDFVLGYGGYDTGKGILNRYIRYDAMMIALQYTGMALRGMPYMGVGRNLAYRRSVFFNNKGFGSHSHLVSGDDDLFVNKLARRQNTVVEIRSETHTRSVPPSSFAGLFRQKRRHLTTANYYKLRDRIILFTEPSTRTLFYLSFIVLISRLYLWQYAAAVFAARLILQSVTIKLATKRFNEPGVFILSGFFDIFSPFLNLAFYMSNYLQGHGKNQWK